MSETEHGSELRASEADHSAYIRAISEQATSEAVPAGADTGIDADRVEGSGVVTQLVKLTLDNKGGIKVEKPPVVEGYETDSGNPAAEGASMRYNLQQPELMQLPVADLGKKLEQARLVYERVTAAGSRTVALRAHFSNVPRNQITPQELK